MMKNLKLDLDRRRQPEMGAGARHRARRHHRPAGAQAQRHRHQPARRARRAGVGGGARRHAGAVPRHPAASCAQQDEQHWGRWPAKLLHNKTVGILGIGVIAEALAPKCKAMGMTVIGITSAPRQVAGFDRVHRSSELLQRAAAARLPRAADALFAGHPPHDRRQGVRGDEAVELSRSTWRAAAWWTRTRWSRRCATRRSPAPRSTCSTQEPLPADHPLWTFQNVIITTHQGGFCDTYVDLAMPILEHNMRCFLKGDLKGMVNVARPAA